MYCNLISDMHAFSHFSALQFLGYDLYAVVTVSAQFRSTLYNGMIKLNEYNYHFTFYLEPFLFLFSILPTDHEECFRPFQTPKYTESELSELY